MKPKPPRIPSQPCFLSYQATENHPAQEFPLGGRNWRKRSCQDHTHSGELVQGASGKSGGGSPGEAKSFFCSNIQQPDVFLYADKYNKPPGNWKGAICGIKPDNYSSIIVHFTSFAQLFMGTTFPFPVFFSVPEKSDEIPNGGDFLEHSLNNCLNESQQSHKEICVSALIIKPQRKKPFTPKQQQTIAALSCLISRSG